MNSFLKISQLHLMKKRRRRRSDAEEKERGSNYHESTNEQSESVTS